MKEGTAEGTCCGGLEGGKYSLLSSEYLGRPGGGDTGASLKISEGFGGYPWSLQRQEPERSFRHQYYTPESAGIPVRAAPGQFNLANELELADELSSVQRSSAAPTQGQELLADLVATERSRVSPLNRHLLNTLGFHTKGQTNVGILRLLQQIVRLTDDEVTPELIVIMKSVIGKMTLLMNMIHYLFVENQEAEFVEGLRGILDTNIHNIGQSQMNWKFPDQAIFLVIEYMEAVTGTVNQMKMMTFLPPLKWKKTGIQYHPILGELCHIFQLVLGAELHPSHRELGVDNLQRAIEWHPSEDVEEQEKAFPKTEQGKPEEPLPDDILINKETLESPKPQLSPRKPISTSFVHDTPPHQTSHAADYDTGYTNPYQHDNHPGFGTSSYPHIPNKGKQRAEPDRDAHKWQVLTSTLLVQFIHEYSPVL
ncbi:hypothetical protein EV361DRAFT_874536, partial [Lentinula raphanica]